MSLATKQSHTPQTSMPMDNSMLKKTAGRFSRLALVAALALPLGACALAGAVNSPPPALYQLQAPSAVQGSVLPLQLVVEEFSTPAAIDTARIVFRPTANELKYFAGARWADRTPRMISTLLIETLSKSGFAGVTGQGGQARVDYTLAGDIRAFAVEGAQGSAAREVNVTLFVRIIRAKDREIIASREFASRQPVAASGMESIVTAYDKALSAVLTDISSWTQTEARRAEATMR